MDSSLYLTQFKFTQSTPYQIEFRQLKEYFNYKKQFKANRGFNVGKIISNEYYLIDRNWLNKWKEIVGYNYFHSLNLNREMNDNDYQLFLSYITQNKNNEDNYIFPLDNSNIYLNNGKINPYAEFVIINRACYQAFKETKQNSGYNNINERTIPIKILKDKLILNICTKIKLICFRDESNKADMEIIIIFMEEKNIEQITNIINEIENDEIIPWLKNRDFGLHGPDELEIDEKGCKMKIINKNLKLKLNCLKNSVVPKTVGSKTTLLVKYNLPANLKKQMETKMDCQRQTMQVVFPKNKNGSDNSNNNQGNIGPEQFFCNNQQNQQQHLNNNNMNNNNINANNYNFNQNYNNQIQQQQQNFNNINQFNMGFNNNNNNMGNNQNMFQINQMNNQNMMQMNQMPMIQGNNQMNMMQMNMSNPNIMQMMQMNFNNNMGINNMNIMNQNNNLSFQISNSNSCPNLSNNMRMEQNQQQKGGNSYIKNNNLYPHHAGLVNVSQSCYMNATIECLSNIKSLSNYLIQGYSTYNIDSQPLCVSFSSLLYDLIYTKQKYIEPKIFKEILGKLNPLFEGNHAADAKDLIFFIIETLHKELLPPSNNNNENNEIDFLQQEQNAKDENKMLNEFIKEFKLNKTTISDIFYGINRSIMKCNNCLTKKYSFQTFNLLIFPLKKVKEYKMRQIGRGNLDLNLYDAFYCEQEAERLEGENMIYCNVCRQLSPGVHQQQIYGMPNILIIILNRGKNNQDFNEEFRFDEILDFTNTNLVVNKKSTLKYYLCGIITHLGESGAGGHFIAYCRSKLNDPFTCYNDAAVSQASVADAMATKISTRDIEKKTPYILLYHYMK